MTSGEPLSTTEPTTGTYSISKLADAAETTPRTIRYYAAEGLLPPPRSEGRYAVYTDSHLLRLHLIQKLKNAYLPLGTIREQIAGLTDAEIETLLGNGDTQTQEPAKEGAKPRLRPSVRLTEPNAGQSGLDYIAQILAVTGQGAAADVSAVPVKPKRALLISPVFRPEAEIQLEAAKIVEESWHRIRLAPGIELHLRQPVAPEDRARVEAIRKLFGASGEETGGKA